MPLLSQSYCWVASFLPGNIICLKEKVLVYLIVFTGSNFATRECFVCYIKLEKIEDGFTGSKIATREYGVVHCVYV